jgi:hypothetical protein
MQPEAKSDVVPEQDATTPKSAIFVTPEDAQDIARSVANDVVAAAFRRAEYEALKVLAWRFPHGTHITAMSVAQAEHHAIYASSEEVIHKEDDGMIVNESWISFLMKYPRWRITSWPSSSLHGDEIVERARRRTGEAGGHNEILNNSEHFVQECYTGSASSSKVSAGAAALVSCAATSSATGAAVAAPFAFSTTTVYVLGVIPWGTATVFSGGTVLAGAAVGAAIGSVVMAPTYWAKRRNALEASLCRLPFCLLNQADRHLHVYTYHLADNYRLVSVMGLAGQSAGYLGPQNILELDPPEDSEEFQVEVVFDSPPAETWTGSAVGTVASAARGVGSLASSLVPRVSFLSSGSQEPQTLRAVVRRGSVYRICELDKAADDAAPNGTADVMEIARVPRTVLPAYGIPWSDD